MHIRKNKDHEHLFNVPHSAADRKHIPIEKKVFSSGKATGKDLVGGTLFDVYRGVIPPLLLDNLEEFIIAHEDQLANFVNDCRGGHLVSFMGSWTPRGGKTANKLYLTPTTVKRAEVVGTLVTKFANLWERVRTVLSWKYSKQLEILEKVPVENRLFGAFSLLILNYSCGSRFHRDIRDWKNGFCAVIPFGEWTGGDLTFPDIGATVKLQKGDIILFQSFNLLHGTEEYTGNRHSIVLCTHNTVINNSL